MNVQATIIPNCYEIHPFVSHDNRGSFIKTFHYESFIKNDLVTEWKEEYYTISRQGVLRGLHFQLPPHDYEKLVYCTWGSVLDVLVDLRVGSPTYGKHMMIDLTADKANIIYIPSGIAHGFYVTSESASMHYKVSSQYVQSHDTGIRWNSAGIDWPDKNPVLSPRDRSFLTFSEFNSPFSLEER
jgi:dTDP-4-dehydrorhamnose 3,5-epimerase